MQYEFDNSNQLDLMLTVNYYNERDFLLQNSEKRDAIIGALATLLHVEEADVTVQPFVSDLGLEAAVRSSLV